MLRLYRKVRGDVAGILVRSDYSISAACDRSVLLASCLLLPLVLVLAFRHLVPENYLYDSTHLHRLVHSSLQPELFSSFGNLAWLVGVVTQGAVPDDLIDIFCGLIALALFGLTLVSCRVEFDFFVLAIAMMFGAVFYVYLTQLSKEILVLTALAMVLWQLKRDRWLMAVLVVLAYALFARSYWLLIVGVWLALDLSARLFGFRVVTTIATILIAISLLILVFDQVNGYPLLAVRDSINASRAMEEVGTGFPYTLAKDAGFGSQLALYGVSAQWYLLPVWMLKSGVVKYFLAFVVQLTISLVVFRAVWKSRHPVAKWSGGSSGINLVIAAYSVLLIFEPDSGSFLKHQAPMLPLILGLAYGRI